MMYRILPAASVLALVGCQPYYPYPQYSGNNNAYAASRAASPAQSSAASGGVPYRPLQVAVAPVATAAGLSPVVPANVAFREIDAHAGDVVFANADPVRKREIANYPDRYAERITLKNGGMFVYEMLNRGEFTTASDAALIKADFDLPTFRERGMAFDPAKLETAGPFIYLAQSSATHHCFVFRAKFGHSASQPAAAAQAPAVPVNEQAYGNVCYPKEAKEPAAVKAEMLDMLSHVRFGRAGTTLVAAAQPIAPAPAPAPAAPVPAAVAAPSPAPEVAPPTPPGPDAAKTASPPPAAAAAKPDPAPAADAKPVVMSLDQCRYRVSFSAPPSPREKPQKEPGASATEYAYESGGYGETAICSCQKDVDYSKLSQFDAVDNVRAHAEKGGFKLQKAVFDDTPELGKELAYEAAGRRGGEDSFLVGRNFYGRCSLSVTAAGASYADLLKARKFVDSVTATPAPSPTPAAQVYNTTITTAAALPPAAPQTPAAAAAAGSGSTAPADAKSGKADGPPAKAVAAAPRLPVDKAELSPPAKKTEDATAAAAATPARAIVRAAQPVANGGDQPADAIVVRLRRLKELLEQKLITPAEYEAKRKAIIDTL